MIGEALLVGGVILLYYVFRGQKTTDAGSETSNTDALNDQLYKDMMASSSTADDQLYKDMMASSSTADDQLYKDMMAAGAWLPVTPEKFSIDPAKAVVKKTFKVGEDVFVGLEKVGTDSMVVARVVVDEILGDASTGPIGRGKISPLLKSGSEIVEGVVQIQGSQQPPMGQVVAIPAAYRLPDDFLDPTVSI